MKKKASFDTNWKNCFQNPENGLDPKWTNNQKERAAILFTEYPEIEKAYKLVNNLRNIFNQTKNKGVAFTKLAHWYKEVEESGFKSFKTVANSIYVNY
ncbi:transposase, partial [Salegentibacter maritimus]|uniref:transposase n=1 Tax=Salegentibacter maritimus TaxID=2794347 RepID=UPI00293D3949